MGFIFAGKKSHWTRNTKSQFKNSLLSEAPKYLVLCSKESTIRLCPESENFCPHQSCVLTVFLFYRPPKYAHVPYALYSYKSSQHNIYCMSHFSCACYKPPPFYSYWPDELSNIWRRVQIIKVITKYMKFSIACFHISPPTIKFYDTQRCKIWIYFFILRRSL